MKKRVLIAGLFHETHTFLDGTTSLSDFQILRGEEMLRCEGDSSPLGGVLEEVRRYGWDIIPTADYRAQPSATVENEVFEAFWADVIQQSRSVLECGGRDIAFEGQTSPDASSAPSKAVSPPLQGSATALQDAAAPIDAIYLVLHGAMVTTTYRDVEGELLRRLREIPAFTKVRIFGVFDLHANFSHDMSRHANCLVGYRENPHTDAREAACNAASLLERSFQTGVYPQTFGISFPILWPPTGTATANEPMKTLNQMARRLEKEHPDIWCISVVAGFSFADTPSAGVWLIPVIDNTSGWSTMRKDEEGKTQLAQHIRLMGPMMTYLRDHRHLGNVTDPPLAEVMAKLPSFTSGLTVLVEPSDNIGGGAPGDGTGLLRAFIEYNVANSAICIADPVASEKARAAGIGSKVTLSLGGKGSRLDAGPVDLEAEVISLSDGHFELEDKQSHLASMCGDTFDMGRCAVVRYAGITILLTSIKTPPFDLGQWRSQGIEPTKLSVICVKAAVAHRRAYDPIAARMFWVDTPGPCSSNLKTLPYQHIRRPIYPLDS